MISRRAQQDIYRSINHRSAVSIYHSMMPAVNVEAIQRSINRLRYLHVPMTLLVLRIRERGSNIARRLLRDRLEHLGYADILSNGDIMMLYLGNTTPDTIRAEAVEKMIIDLVSRQMMAFVVCGLDVKCFAAFTHVWSDEIWDAPDIANLTAFPGVATIEIRPATKSGSVANYRHLN